MSDTARAYLLIAGRLYMAADAYPTEPGNLYPCAFGRLMGKAGDLPGNVITAAHGDQIQLFGQRYEVNCLPTDGTCEDEIDLELVYLSRRDNPIPDLCACCGAAMDDGDPLRAFCPNGPHTLDDWTDARGVADA